MIVPNSTPNYQAPILIKDQQAKPDVNTLPGLLSKVISKAYLVVGYSWIPIILAPTFISFSNRYAQSFWFLFLFRYLRLVINFLGWYNHKSIGPSGKISPTQATIVIPTVDYSSPEFLKTLASCIQSGVKKIVICVGKKSLDDFKWWIEGFKRETKSTIIIEAVTCPVLNKRKQICAAMEYVATEFVIFADDHVFWPENYVDHLLAPFEDPLVGGVCTQKRVIRDRREGLFSRADLGNFIACLYLERHNYDLAGSNGIDGAVFVISGRTAAYRTKLIKNKAFLDHFCNEMWLFGRVGPLNPDDDNCITRHLVKNGYRIHFQRGEAATMETTMGIDGGWQKLTQQLLRWARTTFRSNFTSLVVDRSVYTTQPISVYTVYIALMFNFALYTDVALMVLNYRSGVMPVNYMAAIIFLSKIIKLVPHLRREPKDVLYIPFYIFFGYVHSIIKTVALLTVDNVCWGSRPGVVN